ncbi:McrC family protein [Burkholderia cepacia]|uniref:McrC family protein n=1 Tax=Burkholderia cepacia TaxID=292 RepID=UPI001CF56452|nr:McrC family protein [Burkholderia cepacia]MCA8135667.1 McrC family protein [Burkholderia cepacia]
MRHIVATEGVDFQLSSADAQKLRRAVERLSVQLKPSFSLLSERAGAFKLMNVIGTIDLGSGVFIQVSPKVQATADWTTAVVSLLTGSESIDIAGERRAGLSSVHNKLLDALSGAYLVRLETAFRQDGPIVLMERVSKELSYLHGKLDVTRWARSALWRPQVFPVSRTEPAQDNPFTRCLTHVAEKLAHATHSQEIRNKLRAVARDLSAGMPKMAQGAPTLTRQPLPEQWSAYKPAWSLAISIMSRTSLLGAKGNHNGVGLAIEAWPLLETLLERTLQSVQKLGVVQGRQFTYQMQGSVRLLTPVGGPPQKPFAPEPDGRLFENNTLIATFEAKYTEFEGEAPSRNHIYQALSTAAACGAPTAILVYPNSFSPIVWNVSGFQGRPSRLIALGLDMFTWLPTTQAQSRAQMILDVLRGPSHTPNINLTKVVA